MPSSNFMRRASFKANLKPVQTHMLRADVEHGFRKILNRGELQKASGRQEVIHQRVVFKLQRSATETSILRCGT